MVYIGRREVFDGVNVYGVLEVLDEVFREEDVDWDGGYFGYLQDAVVEVWRKIGSYVDEYEVHFGIEEVVLNPNVILEFY